jgi:D-alanyl-D-alanine-carboxypeptidase/D-alanyl-D-alanine-endopeptidase
LPPVRDLWRGTGSAANDCVLGNVLFHGGGFPGYGSHMLLMPETGGRVCADQPHLCRADRAGLGCSHSAVQIGLCAPRAIATTRALETGYAAARRIWAAGGVEGEGQYLAMNFAMDRSDANWRQYLAGSLPKAGHATTARL